MSLSIDYVVDVEASLIEAPALAEQVIAMLIERGIVLPTPKRSELHGEGARYATGPNVGHVATHNDCFACGVDVEIGRNIYMPGENGLDALNCPACNQSHALDGEDWLMAIGEWSHGSGHALLTCRHCGHAASIVTWRFKPVWGFGDLAFQFTEWHLNEEFVKQIAEVLGHRVAWVKSHW